MKKNYILTACMLVFFLTLTACSGGSDKKQNTSESKYDIGMELIANLREISKDESYANTFLSGAEDAVAEMVDGIRAMDYSHVEHIYRVKNMDEVITAGMYMAEFDNDASSDIVKSVLEAKFVFGISDIITARRTGTIALAVESTFVTDTTFVDASIKDCEVYVYTFKEAYPVMVCYVPGKDGAVSATANYIIVDDYIGVDGDALSKDIGFSVLNVKLEEVENK